MDKARPIIAITLCLAIWGAYYLWYLPAHTPPKKVPAADAPGGEKIKPKTDNGTGTKPPPDGTETPEKPPEVPKFVHPKVAQTAVVIQSEAIELHLTTTGASAKKLVLRKYNNEVRPKEPLALLDEFVAGRRSFALIDPNKAVPLDTADWEIVPANQNEAAFRFTTGDGLRITKTYGFGPESHALKLKIEVENLSTEPLARSWDLVGAAGIDQEGSGGTYPGGAYGLWKDGKAYATKVEESELELKTISEKPWESDSKGVAWIGVQNKFFAVALIPLDQASISRVGIQAMFFEQELNRRLAMRDIPPGDPRAKEHIDWTTNTLAFGARLSERTYKPGEKSTLEFLVYAGPKDDDALEEGRFKDARLGDLLDFGWFGFISRLLLWIMGGLHAVVRNWGIAIIILVLIVRCCIFPISKKAQVSMFKMSKLQPHIKAMQEKHKGDALKQNEAVMALMREHGVTPFGGCAPMLLQLPIFLGLYNALLKDIHLRQQPFFGWINDLSQPETLFTLPFTIFGGNGFHILPIIMTITWVTQAALAPKSPDPQMRQQQKIFTFMPLIFGFMMYSTPSGLVLYWLISTAWGIAEQQYIKKKYMQ